MKSDLRWALSLATWFAGAAFALPLIYLVVRSVNGGGAYAGVLSARWFYVGLANTLMLAGTAAVVSVLVSSAAGYALARYRFPGRQAYGVAVVLLAALPPQLLVPGGFELVAGLGLLDSRWAVLLPALLSVLAVLLFSGAFSALPGELLEAARLDGCSEWAVFWQVALPAVRPTVSACLVLTFAGTYNAVVWPAVMLQSPELQTLGVKIAVLSGTALTADEQAAVQAATVLGLVPVLVLFAVMQREFLPGLLQGRGK